MKLRALAEGAAWLGALAVAALLLVALASRAPAFDRAVGTSAASSGGPGWTAAVPRDRNEAQYIYAQIARGVAAWRKAARRGAGLLGLAALAGSLFLILRRLRLARRGDGRAQGSEHAARPRRGAPPRSSEEEG